MASVPGGTEMLKIKQFGRLLTAFVLILGLAATMATACLAQGFALLPGPSDGGFNPGYPTPQNGPAFTPGFPTPQNQPSFTPGFPTPQNQPPGPGAPVEPGSGLPNQPVPTGPNGPLPAQVPGPDILPQPSPLTAGANPDFPGRSSEPAEPDDMMGFGGMGGMGGMGGFGGGMNPIRLRPILGPLVPQGSRRRTGDRSSR